MKCNVLISTLILTGFTVIGTPASAEPRDAGSQEAARAELLLRQIADERDALKGENAKLQEQVDNLKKDLDSRTKELDHFKKSLNTSGSALSQEQEKNKALMDRLLETRQKFQEVIDKFKDTIATLRSVEADRAQVKATLSDTNREVEDRTRELSACIRKNIDLYQADLGLVEQYEHKGVWAALFQKEPVTGFKQVQIENAVQQYQIRLDELRAVAPTVQTSKP